VPLAIELTLRESFNGTKILLHEIAGGYNIMLLITEHASSQSLAIQNPSLPVRQGQHCLSSFNRGAWNSQITMAEAVFIVPLFLSGCHFII
jgi:hypothetical protein